ncbi:HAD family hydrolase [Streptomyces sp. NPDC059010]|uniref:HAD family hydrolase n=1 Tax=Streptomyces sp. NPDC059010 TaxID=3346695 RepID=UPI0036832438
MGDAAGERETLLGLLEHADAVFLDFDGPVCDLFGDASTAPVAREIKKAVRAVWDSDLGPDIERCDDSHGILRHVRDLYEGPLPVPPRLREAIAEAEEIVRRQEYAAIDSARPAPDVTGLVTALRDMGMRLAIVSNNAPGPVESYLERKGLRWAFKEVIGRDPHEPRHMKPHPDSVDRALESLGGLPPSACVLIGDQITDLQAAQAAKTRFIGYTRYPRRAAEMLELGADAVVSSHAPLIGAAEALRKPN